MSKLLARCARLLLACCSVVACLAITTPAAHAFNAKRVVQADGSVHVVVDAAAGEANDLTVTAFGPDDVMITDASTSSTRTSGFECRHASSHPRGVLCPKEFVTLVVVQLADGNDRLHAFDTDQWWTVPPIQVHGGDGADTIDLTLGAHAIAFGDAGSDTITSAHGPSTLDGGADADTIQGGGGDDVIDGGTGADRLDGGVAGFSHGRDTLSYAGRTTGVTVTFDGIANDGGSEDGAADSRDAVTGFERLVGGSGPDTLRADTTRTLPFELLGGSGNDVLNGGASNDQLDGGVGSDELHGADGADTLAGAEGADVLNGGPGDDTLDGGGAGDELNGGAGLDAADYRSRIDGGFMSPNLNVSIDGVANDGNSFVDGTRFTGATDNVALDVERVFGGEGNDTLVGSGNVDQLYGGAGSDWITGGSGADVLVGEGGNDTIDAVDADGAIDGVSCGDGTDGASGDMHDTFTACETVDAPVPPAPSNITAPTVGTKNQYAGCTLGTWDNSPKSFDVTLVATVGATRSGWDGQVQVTSMPVPADWQLIDGTYHRVVTLGPEWQAAQLECRVEARNRNPASAVATSTPLRLGRVGLAAPARITDGPVVRGGTLVGDQVTCDPGPWSGTPELAYAWLRADGQVHASGASYVLKAEDHGIALTCRATDVGPSPHPPVYASNAVATDARPRGSSDSIISGAGAIGAQLSCNPGTWTGATSIGYRWFRAAAATSADGVQVSTASTYVVTAEDAGAYLRCVATAANAYGARAGTPAAALYVELPPPPPPAPPADRRAPIVRLTLPKVVRLSPVRPVLLLRFTCPANEVRCRYASTLTYRAGRRSLLIGRSTALVNRRQTRLTSVPLNARGKQRLRRLGRRGSIRATLTVVVTDKAGNRRTVRRAVWLRRR